MVGPMADDRAEGNVSDGLVELPSWVKRVRPDAHPAPRRRTLSDRLREAAGDSEDVIDLVSIERDIERLRTDA
jgi:hypothetical protein